MSKSARESTPTATKVGGAGLFGLSLLGFCAVCGILPILGVAGAVGIAAVLGAGAGIIALILLIGGLVFFTRARRRAACQVPEGP